MYELKDYLNDINYKKDNLMDSEDEFWEKRYPGYIVNKVMSAFPDTLLFANEINQLHYLDKKLQYDFLIYGVRKKKRFSKWMKASKLKNLEYIREYYGYNNEKARLALELLTKDQLDIIKQRLSKGGKL